VGRDGDIKWAAVSEYVWREGSHCYHTVVTTRLLLLFVYLESHRLRLLGELEVILTRRRTLWVRRRRRRRKRRSRRRRRRRRRGRQRD
jgi:hypothetical protein